MVRTWIPAVLLCVSALFAAPSEHVVLISIDGMAAYQLYNQETELPHIRSLISKGAWFESSQTIFPSVTHPGHTTIVTGVEPRIHGVLSNTLVDRQTGEQFFPTNKARKDIVKVPTLFDAAKAKGMRTAAFFWPETREDPAIDFNVPEVFTPARKADREAVSTKVMDELRSNGVPIDAYFRWYATERMAGADAVLTEAAAYAIRKYKPNLLAIHLLAADEAQHQFGPHSYQAQAAFSSADACIGLLLDAVKDAGIDAKTTFVVTSDHGFHSVGQEAPVLPAFEAAGLKDKVKLSGGGWTMAVETLPSFQPSDEPALQSAISKLMAAGIVRKAVKPDEMHALGMPRFEESNYTSGQYLLIPDIDTYLIAGAPGAKLEKKRRSAPAHSHGYLPTHPRMFTSLVISGAGIRQGVNLPHTTNLSIAPTIAALLGIDLPSSKAAALKEALAP